MEEIAIIGILAPEQMDCFGYERDYRQGGIADATIAATRERSEAKCK